MDRYRVTLPDMPEDEVVRRMYFFVGIVAYVMAGRDVMPRLVHGAPATPTDPESRLRALLPFIVGGLQAPALPAA